MTSAEHSALSCPTERELRVPCYCEENVWRLAYRRLHNQREQSPPNHDNGIPHDDHSQIAMNHNMINNNNPNLHVVFISSEGRCCPMVGQLARSNPNEPCWWDYHVILLEILTTEEDDDNDNHHHDEGNNNQRDNNINPPCIVWDMDSHLSFPSPIRSYISKTFSFLQFIKHEYKGHYEPLFRVLPAQEYLNKFRSDRMHMYDESTDSWNAPPPSYDCILGDGASTDKNNHHDSLPSSNIDDFRWMTRSNTHTRMQGNEINPNGGRTIANRALSKSSIGDVLTLEELLKRFG
mmetsp:Transcript_2857/g.4042  ORF Transcript_2857/g.4042 Transcript_2857/m.4042 type:complete len:292 (+) Transcript_2857:127-1002(+)